MLALEQSAEQWPLSAAGRPTSPIPLATGLKYSIFWTRPSFLPVLLP